MKSKRELCKFVKEQMDIDVHKLTEADIVKLIKMYIVAMAYETPMIAYGYATDLELDTDFVLRIKGYIGTMVSSRGDD